MCGPRDWKRRIREWDRLVENLLGAGAVVLLLLGFYGLLAALEYLLEWRR